MEGSTPSLLRHDGDAGVSLAVLWRPLPEAVDDRGLGDSEREPAAAPRLDPHEELVGVLARLLVQLLVALEAHLVAELRDQRAGRSRAAPHGQVGLGLDAVAEVEHADGLHAPRSCAPPAPPPAAAAGVLEHVAQRGEHRERVRDVRVEMRSPGPVSTQLCENRLRMPPAPSRGGSSSSLNLIGRSARSPAAGRLPPRPVEVRMAKLDRELGVGGRPPVTVRRAAAHDERRLVEREPRRVVEQDLAQPIVRRDARFVRDADVRPRARSCTSLPNA